MEFCNGFYGSDELAFYKAITRTPGDLRLLTPLTYGEENGKVYLIYPKMKHGNIVEYIDNRKTKGVNEFGYLEYEQTCVFAKDMGIALDNLESLGFCDDDAHLMNFFPTDEKGSSFLLGDFGNIRKVDGSDPEKGMNRVRSLFSTSLMCLLAGEKLDKLCQNEVVDDDFGENWRELRGYYFQDWPLEFADDENSSNHTEIPNSITLNELLREIGYSEQMINLLESFELPKNTNSYSEMAEEFVVQLEKEVPLSTF